MSATVRDAVRLAVEQDAGDHWRTRLTGRVHTAYWRPAQMLADGAMSRDERDLHRMTMCGIDPGFKEGWA